jgi:hypothetical protein
MNELKPLATLAKANGPLLQAFGALQLMSEPQPIGWARANAEQPGGSFGAVLLASRPSTLLISSS